jgi:hypothetical protein
MNTPHSAVTGQPAAVAECSPARRLAHKPILGFLLALLAGPLPAGPAHAGPMLDTALDGPMKHHRQWVFAVRGLGPDGHWYANFGKYAPERLSEIPVFPSGASLRVLDLETGHQRVLLDDPQGGIRDPQVHYDGRKILFSYRPGGTSFYHLFEISVDGSGLRRLTDGPFDDIEPTYLPDGDIVFVSSRCKRWVNCWLTPVANLHRCDPDGSAIRMISLNIEHDNTPWLLPDGRLLYTRWEYIDRSQVHYHHLWTANPDGTAPMTWYGNLEPGVVMIDSKPVPDSHLVVSVFSPGHGQKEHAGSIALVDPKAGPDHKGSVRKLTKAQNYRDPWALSGDCVIAARDHSLVLLDGSGREEQIFRLSDEETKARLWIHEPRPLAPRQREALVVYRTRPDQTTGTMLLMDAKAGRRMDGVADGEIKQLLVMESLPKPINFTGGMEPLSYGGTFTLERVLGTVPVESDGSAYFEVPAMRSVFFIALDEAGNSVKRMQSFTGVQPGEQLGCVGCHEHRSSAPPAYPGTLPLAATRPPSAIKPYPDLPDVLDFPRDIQPILNRHCVECHQTGDAEGGVILTGDHGPMYSHSYFSLTVTSQLADGRNRAQSNYPPRALGSGAAPLLRKLEGDHQNVEATPREILITRLWLDSGAPYPGTYAALGTGMIGGYESNEQVINHDANWPETRAAAAAIERRCTSCHQQANKPLPRSLSDEIGFSFWMPDLKDQRIRRNRHIVFNLTRPEQSLMLRAPLARTAGGDGTCASHDAPPVFSSTGDPDYQAILAMCAAGHRQLQKVKRFDMPGFTPRPEWIAEMQRFGILPPDPGPQQAPLDVYAIEQAYWKSLHHPPPTASP